MEIALNEFFPYLAAVVYFLFQDWFKKIPKEWYLSVAIIIPILVIFFPLKIHANIIRLILESLLLILAYHAFNIGLSCFFEEIKYACYFRYIFIIRIINGNFDILLEFLRKMKAQ